jgi:hypothetical protein
LKNVELAYNRAFLSRVFGLNFNLNYCLCILDYRNGLPLYVPDILIKDFNDIRIIGFFCIFIRLFKVNFIYQFSNNSGSHFCVRNFGIFKPCFLFLNKFKLTKLCFYNGLLLLYYTVLRHVFLSFLKLTSCIFQVILESSQH